MPAEVKNRRLKEVIDTFHEVAKQKNQMEVGREHLVLVEGVCGVCFFVLFFCWFVYVPVCVCVCAFVCVS